MILNDLFGSNLPWVIMLQLACVKWVQYSITIGRTLILLVAIDNVLVLEFKEKSLILSKQ